MRQYSNHYLPVTFCIIAASALFLVSGCVRSPFKTLKLPDGSTIEYVEVRDEPDHRQQFENASARLYEVVILPGKTTLYHRHSQNTIYLTVSPTKISSRLAGSEQVDELEFLQGAVSFNPQRDNPFNHVVSNIGQLNAHFVGVELYDTGRTFDHLRHNSLRPVFEQWRKFWVWVNVDEDRFLKSLITKNSAKSVNSRAWFCHC
jgi:hypothetical protein